MLLPPSEYVVVVTIFLPSTAENPALMGTSSPDKAYILEASWARVRRVLLKSLLALAMVLVAVVLSATFAHGINDPMGGRLDLTSP